jgi:hypothetical protein
MSGSPLTSTSLEGVLWVLLFADVGAILSVCWGWM